MHKLHPLNFQGRVKYAAAALAALFMSAAVFAQGNVGPVAGQGPGNVGAPFQIINGHLSLGNIAAPTLTTGCGTGASSVGNDSVARVVSGTSSASSCQIKFVTPWNQPPICSVDNQTSAAQATFNVTPTQINLLGVADSQTYNIVCIGQAGG